MYEIIIINGRKKRDSRIKVEGMAYPLGKILCQIVQISREQKFYTRMLFFAKLSPNPTKALAEG